MTTQVDVDVDNSAADNLLNEMDKATADAQPTADRSQSSAVRTVQQEQEEEGQDDRSLDAWRPLYLSLLALGLIWRRRRRHPLTEWRRWDPCTAHCCVTLTLAWLNVLKYFPAYSREDTYGTWLFKKMCFHLYALQMACGISCCVYFWHRRMAVFVREWRRYKLKYKGVSINTMRRHVLMRVVVINTITLCLWASSTVYILLGNSENYNRFELALFVYFRDHKPTWLQMLNSTVNIYLRLAWLQSVIFCVCITKNLKDEFQFFTLELQEAVENHNNPTQPACFNNATKSSQIEAFRLQFQDLCRLVGSYDNVVSLYLLFLYLFSVPIIVFLIYALWEVQSNTLGSFVVLALSLFSFVAMLILVTGTSASLSTTVSGRDVT